MLFSLFFLVFFAVSLVQNSFQVRIAFRIILLSRGGYGLRLTAKLGFYSVFKLFLTKLEEIKCLFEKKLSYYQDFYWIFACLQKLLSSSSAFRISLFFFASTSTLLTLLASFKKSFHNKNNLYFRKGGGAHFYVLLVTFIRFVYFLFCSFFFHSCLAFFVGVILLC